MGGAAGAVPLQLRGIQAVSRSLPCRSFPAVVGGIGVGEPHLGIEDGSYGTAGKLEFDPLSRRALSRKHPPFVEVNVERDRPGFDEPSPGHDSGFKNPRPRRYLFEGVVEGSVPFTHWSKNERISPAASPDSPVAEGPGAGALDVLGRKADESQLPWRSLAGKCRGSGGPAQRRRRRRGAGGACERRGRPFS